MIKNYLLSDSASGFTATAQSALTSISFCNDDSSERTVTVYIIASGGSANSTSQNYKNIPIAAGETFELSFEGKTKILDAADSVQALADVASKVSMSLSILEL